ncbi:hypothetical protein B0J17DRAFT_658719 [Rhizoctonia solani]|nr:hypothetical protein B0J17DRAFT_658719 [Rhizoctonia solani]
MENECRINLLPLGRMSTAIEMPDFNHQFVSRENPFKHKILDFIIKLRGFLLREEHNLDRAQSTIHL